MIPNGEVLHHLAVRKLSVLETEITSKHDGSSTGISKSGVVMPSKYTKIY